MLELNKIYHGDCFELIEQIPDKSVDMILEDMPYGTTACKWDQGKISEDQKLFLKWFDDIPFNITFQDESYLFYWEMFCDLFNKLFRQPIDLAEYWKSRKRIIKDNGVIVLTASQPFTSLLVMSNLKMFKYFWYWNKKIPSCMLRAKYRPLNQIEDICVFSIDGKKTRYNPQKIKRDKIIKSGGNVASKELHNNFLKKEYRKTYQYKEPITLITFDKIRRNLLNPTQKPVPLFGYLIKTYTNEGDLVVDGFAGSGTTGEACLRTKRNFICIEKDLEMFQKAEKRIKIEQSKLTFQF